MAGEKTSGYISELILRQGNSGSRSRPHHVRGNDVMLGSYPQHKEA